MENFIVLIHYYRETIETMSSENLDHVFKILLIGDAGVGKSRFISLIFMHLIRFFDCFYSGISILLQFTDGYFNENLQSTIGMPY